MPLKAHYGQHVMIAPLLGDDEWQRLRQDVKGGTVELGVPCGLPIERLDSATKSSCRAAESSGGRTGSIRRP